ncbi:hypothetical protein KH5_03880 [Urechidicola sp. KH5]
MFLFYKIPIKYNFLTTQFSRKISGLFSSYQQIVKSRKSLKTAKKHLKWEMSVFLNGVQA